MSIVLSGIRIGIDDVEQEALEEARRLLRVGKNQILQIVPVKKSLDARRRDHISVVYSVRVDLADEEQKYAKAARFASDKIESNIWIISRSPLKRAKKNCSIRSL